MLNKYSGSGTINKPDYQLANELHKPIIKKFRKRKVFSSYGDDKWPEHISQELRPHFTTRNELSIENDIIIRGLRIVIPSCYTTRFYLNFTRITRVCQEWYRWADYIFGFWTLIKKSKSLLKLVKPTKNYQTPQTKACHTLGIGPFSLWIVFTLIYLSSKKKFCLAMVDSYSKWIEINVAHSWKTVNTIKTSKLWFPNWVYRSS